MRSFDRRQFIGAVGGIATAQIVPMAALARPVAGAEAVLSGMAEEILREFPENATGLGIDKGARAGLKSQLTDRSPVGTMARGAAAARRLADLKAIDRKRLSKAAVLDVEVTQAAHQISVDGYKFPFGDVANLNQAFSYRNGPYAVAQNTGAVYEVPDFLDSIHIIENAADADAYLARLESYGDAIDGETARLAHDAGLGVVAPSFLLDKTLRQHKATRATPVAESGLIASLAKRVTAFPGDRVARAERIVAERINPALDRQIAELQHHRDRATGDAGVWKLPQGDAYYAWALRAGTTTNLSPDEVHARGMAELSELQARMDVLLKAQGLSQGTVGARMTALGKNPKQLFPNTDAGRAQILAYVNDRVADIRQRLPRAFATLVPGRLLVKRVPVAIEAGAPGGYAGAGTIDGSQPGLYYINLRDTGIWPRHSLPTLTYHEGIPGHIWQGEYTYKLPLIRSLLAFNAYSEGWALYAEQLADELGVYEGDPLGKLGYLQSLSFRACRLVVDTGIHAKRWTRAQAIEWFATTNGSSVEEVSSEVDRYCAWPGQACGYKIGHSEINRVRTSAMARPGYDFRRFNDAMVLGGGVPLTVLDQLSRG